MSFSSLQWGETHIVQTIGLWNLYRAPAFPKTHCAYGQGVCSIRDPLDEKGPGLVGHVSLPGLIHAHPCRRDSVGVRISNGATDGIERLPVCNASLHIFKASL